MSLVLIVEATAEEVHRVCCKPMTFGRSLQRHLNHFDLPTVFTEWAHLAQDRAGWHKLVTTPPFAIGKPFVRQPRGDTRVTPEDRRRAVAQRAAEVAKRRAVFDANNSNWGSSGPGSCMGVE